MRFFLLFVDAGTAELTLLSRIGWFCVLDSTRLSAAALGALASKIEMGRVCAFLGHVK